MDNELFWLILQSLGLHTGEIVVKANEAKEMAIGYHV
jgi:hypothetical protein